LFSYILLDVVLVIGPARPPAAAAAWSCGWYQWSCPSCRRSTYC